MSLQTWKIEFMPLPASVPKTAMAAIAHSQRKWQGLTPENLKKHGLTHEGYEIFDDEEILDIDETSCALCHLFIDSTFGCPKCPLTEARGRTCDVRSQKDFDNDRLAPYQAFTNDGDPKPMIKLLKRAAKLALEVEE